MRHTLVALTVLLALFGTIFALDDVRNVRLCTEDCLQARHGAHASCLRECSLLLRDRSNFAEYLAEEFEHVPDDSPEEDDFSKKSSPLWEAYKSELFKFFKATANPAGMQIIKQPFSAVYDLDPESQTLAQILNPVCENGPVRQIATPSSNIPSEYGQFINNLKVKTVSPQEAARLEEAEAKYQQFENIYQEKTIECQEKFEKMKSFFKMPYEKFAVQMCFSLSTARQDRDSQRINLEYLRNDILGNTAELVKALDSYTAFEKQGVFPWVESPLASLSTFRERIRRGATSSFRIQITQSSLSKESEKTKYTVPVATENEPFIATKTGEKLKVSTASEDFKMQISASGFYAVQVQPDAWFSSKVVQDYKRGPFVDSSVGKTFFGPSGKLNKIPRTLYMVYRPTITLQVEEGDVEQFQKSSTVRVGPFRGRVVDIREETKPVSSSTTTTTTTTTTSTTQDGETQTSTSETQETPEEPTKTVYHITIEDNRHDPLVVAVDNELM